MILPPRQKTLIRAINALPDIELAKIGEYLLLRCNIVWKFIRGVFIVIKGCQNIALGAIIFHNRHGKNTELAGEHIHKTITG